MKAKLFKLLTKYALLLAFFYFAVYALGIVMTKIDLDDLPREYVVYKSFAAPGLNMLLNIVTAIILAGDIDRYNIRTKYVIFATLVFRPIGVVAFLLFCFLQDNNDANSNPVFEEPILDYPG